MSETSPSFEGSARALLARPDLLVLLAICGLLLASQMQRHQTLAEQNQWDFRSHYFAARAWLAGESPYDIAAANRSNTTTHAIPKGHDYPYHPYTLPYFLLFGGQDFEQATQHYVWFNVALLLALLCLWKLFLLPADQQILLLPVVALFAFNQCTMIALAAGNPAILEATLIWLALICFVHDRPLGFLIPLLLISFFKGTPLVLTPLVLLLPDPRRNLRLLLLCLAGAGAVWLSPLLLDRELFLAWWSYASNVRELGITNPASFSLIADFFRLFEPETTWPERLVYAAWLLTMLGAFGHVVRSLELRRDRTGLALLSILTYALIVPRFKDYAFIQLLPVAALLLPRAPGLIIVVFFGLFFEGARLPYFLRHYFPFFAALICWGCLAYQLRLRSTAPDGPRA